MQRRTFIKSIAAAFASTAVFSLGKTIATDGRLLIAVDEVDTHLDGEGRYPDVTFLAWDEFDEGGFQSFDKLTMTTSQEEWYCPDCLGNGSQISPDLNDVAAPGGKLNPPWVEWLMGWPIGWTGLNAVETDKFLQWLSKHGQDYSQSQAEVCSDTAISV